MDGHLGMPNEGTGSTLSQQSRQWIPHSLQLKLKLSHRGFCTSGTRKLGLNSGKRILNARILDPNSWVEFLVLSSKRGPQKNSPSRNSPPKTNLPKFNPEIGKSYSHCTSAGPFEIEIMQVAPAHADDQRSSWDRSFNAYAWQLHDRFVMEVTHGRPPVRGERAWDSQLTFREDIPVGNALSVEVLGHIPC